MTSFYLDLLDILKPENKEEADLLAIPEVQAGLRWGLPRYGHPEGEVYKERFSIILTKLTSLLSIAPY